eukprot:1250324-Lingulodinium_polyedra.AAC.1
MAVATNKQLVTILRQLGGTKKEYETGLGLGHDIDGSFDMVELFGAATAAGWFANFSGDRDDC